MKNQFINLSDPAIFNTFGGEEYWEKISYLAGEKILEEGGEGRDFYYILSGSVDVTKTLSDKYESQKHLATLGAGDFFGEGSLLSQAGRGATVAALSQTEVLKLSPKNFEKLLKADSTAACGILLGIVKVLNSRLQATNTRLIALYDVSRIMTMFKGNLAQMIPAIFIELSRAIEHFSMAMFGIDGLPMYTSIELNPDVLAKFEMHIPDYFNRFRLGGAPEFFHDPDGTVYCAVHKSDGTLLAVLACEVCEDFQDEETRLLVTIAEQIGNVL